MKAACSGDSGAWMFVAMPRLPRYIGVKPGKENTMTQEFVPIIRMTSHRGILRPIAIVSAPFFSRGELRAEIYDFEANEHAEVSVFWINRFTIPARGGAGESTSAWPEWRITRWLTTFYPHPHPAPVFDRGGTEPMQSWMGARMASGQ